MPKIIVLKALKENRFLKYMRAYRHKNIDDWQSQMFEDLQGIARIAQEAHDALIEQEQDDGEDDRNENGQQ